LLESAIAQPMASFGGVLLHRDLFEMAAAYLFHIVKNHPFVDGNKRAGAAAALAFLEINDVEFELPEGMLYDITIATARGQMDKTQIADVFRKYARS
jgi:death-on-curing protein